MSEKRGQGKCAGRFRSSRKSPQPQWLRYVSTNSTAGAVDLENILVTIPPWGRGCAAKFVAKHIGQRLPEDKGARLVRYSKGTNRVGTRFTWTSQGAYLWRSKLGAFCRMLGLNSDNHKEFLKQWFGRNWVWRKQNAAKNTGVVAALTGT